MSGMKTQRCRVGMAFAMAPAALFVALCAVPSHADVWDVQSDNDDLVGSDNELLHGVNQVHDLGVRPGPVADQDWYLMPQKPRASYEVIIDGVSGDLGFSGLALERLQVAGTAHLAADRRGRGDGLVGLQPCPALDERDVRHDQRRDDPRRRARPCGTTCGADDVYAIHARETTVNLARFNASGGQATILLTQNVSERPVNATYFYWNSGGTLLATESHRQPSAEGAERPQRGDRRGGRGPERPHHGRSRRRLRRAQHQVRRAGARDRLQLRHAGHEHPLLDALERTARASRRPFAPALSRA